MISYSGKISHGLVLLSFALSLHHVCGRYIKPVTYGYELGSPFGEGLFALDQEGDLSASAAEPRPVFVELVKRPLSLPLVADAGVVSAPSEAPAISASEKVEKTLRQPMAFSFNTDQTHAASDHILKSPKEKLQALESQHRIDQQPDSVDYYKYIAHLQDDDRESGSKGAEEKKEKSASQKQEVSKEAEEKDDSDIRRKSKPHIYLNYSPSNFYKQFAHADLPTEDFPKATKEKLKAEESKKSKDEDHTGHAHHHHFIHHHHHEPKLEKIVAADVETKPEASESHEEHKAESNDQQSGSTEEQKEDVQASASGHGGGGAGGNYKKGGGREFQSVNEGKHGQEGEKKYTGVHHHEKGEKGHKDKDDHLNEYEEKVGHKDGQHEEDGYEAEHQHGEEGKRGTQFHEEGEHSKGHSTQGEHNVHKKDEYEKKQEFYDESHEGGEHEKHGEYFHEDDYNKGGHHKSDHHKGGANEEHYGKKKNFEEGGHDHQDKGHKTAVGHEIHHDHEDKEGEESEEHGGKSYKYQKGTGGGGGGDNKGAHQTVQEVVKDGKAEASDHGKEAEDSKGADYHVHEITIEKTLEKLVQGDPGLQQAQATEQHDISSQEPYDFGGIDIYNGHGGANVRADASQHYPTLDAGQEQKADLQKEGGDAKAEKLQSYQGFGHLYGAETRPQTVNQEPKKDEGNFATNSKAYYTLRHNQPKNLHEGHVHENGQICPGGEHAEAASEQAPQVAEPADSSEESHGQGEESVVNSHILVVGSDGNIYGVLSKNDGLLGRGV